MQPYFVYMFYIDIRSSIDADQEIALTVSNFGATFARDGQRRDRHGSRRPQRRRRRHHRLRLHRRPRLRPRARGRQARYARLHLRRAPGRHRRGRRTAVRGDSGRDGGRLRVRRDRLQQRGGAGCFCAERVRWCAFAVCGRERGRHLPDHYHPHRYGTGRFIFLPVCLSRACLRKSECFCNEI